MSRAHKLTQRKKIAWTDMLITALGQQDGNRAISIARSRIDVVQPKRTKPASESKPTNKPTPRARTVRKAPTSRAQKLEGTALDPHHHAVPWIWTHPAEWTCTACGETWNTPNCYRCKPEDPANDNEPGDTIMIPTISYLRPGEYVIRS